MKQTSPCISSEQTRKLAWDIRSLYLSHKRAHLSNPNYEIPKKADLASKWLAAAANCAALSASPDRFLAACFARAEGPAGPPVDFVCGQRALWAWQAEMSTKASDTVCDQKSLKVPPPVLPDESDSTNWKLEYKEWMIAWDRIKSTSSASTQNAADDRLDYIDIIPHWLLAFHFPNDNAIWEKCGYQAKVDLRTYPRLARYLRSVSSKSLNAIEGRSFPPSRPPLIGE